VAWEAAEYIYSARTESVNTALEKVTGDAALNIRGTIFYKSVQILAHADDISIIGRTQSAMFEAFNSLEKAAKDMNLLINPLAY
jgi:chromosomal replication initiation ATPase DnaA